MKKGISAVIGTILMLLITVALAGSAYMYVSGMLTGKTSKTISVLDVSCSGTTITLVISNDGTDAIDAATPTTDLKIFINNGEDTAFTFSPTSISPHSTGVSSNFAGNSGTNTVLVVSPSNAARQVVYC